MKPARHALIIELISNYSVETQYDLAKLLREHGIHVTQATVSRDIKELRLVKVLMDNGRYKYATSDVTKTGLQDPVYEDLFSFCNIVDIGGQSDYSKDDNRYSRGIGGSHRFP